MEVINDLVGYNNIKIYQNDEWFKFSLESILLPRFVTINMRYKNILDLCTGNAPIPLILSLRTKAKIYAIELQEDIYSLALKTIKINNLGDQINVINDDIKNVSKYFNNDFFDLITINPPYFKENQLTINKNEHKTIARHETCINLLEIITISKLLLKNDARLAMVHRTERLIEIITLLKENNLTPKKIQFIYPNEKSDSNLFMIEAVKNGKDGLELLKPLYVHNMDGSYKDEIKEYFKEEMK